MVPLPNPDTVEKYAWRFGVYVMLLFVFSVSVVAHQEALMSLPKPTLRFIEALVNGAMVLMVFSFSVPFLTWAVSSVKSLADRRQEAS